MQKFVNKRRNLNKNKIKYPKYLIIFFPLLFLILILNNTYSLFMKTYQSNDNIYQTGSLSIDFTSTSDILNIPIVPLSDIDGMNTNPYTFNIVNSGNLNYQFSLHLKDIDYSNINCDNDDNIICYLKVSLNGGDPVSLTDDNNFLIEERIIILSSNTLKMNLKIWLESTAPNTILNQAFNGQIVIDGLATISYRGRANLLSNYGSMIKDNTSNQNYRFTGGGCDSVTYDGDNDIINKSDCTTINNYVWFNNELWRIIGIFNVNDGTSNVSSLKIVKDIPLTNLVRWNSNFTIEGYYGADDFQFYNTEEECKINNIECIIEPSSTNSDFGMSTIKDYLNDNYYNSLDISSKTLIQNTIWQVGGIDFNQIDSLTTLYEKERNNTYYECIDNDDDGIDDNNFQAMNDIYVCSSPTSVYAMNVGLIYPSDYYYASSNDNCTTNYSDGVCINNNWINATNNNEWLLSPGWYIDEILTAKEANSVLSLGRIDSYLPPFSEAVVRPSVYLKPNVSIVSGNGTIEEPYLLSIS